MLYNKAILNNKGNNMIKLILALLVSTSVSGADDWYTTINGAIYETPIVDCPGCVIESVIIHHEDRWVQLVTDRISINGFD